MARTSQEPKSRDQGKQRKQIDRGKRAEQLLKNPLLEEAFAAIEDKITMAWKSSASEDDRGRYNAYLMQRLLQQLKGTLTSYVRSGESALALLEKELQSNGEGANGQRPN